MMPWLYLSGVDDLSLCGSDSSSEGERQFVLVVVKGHRWEEKRREWRDQWVGGKVFVNGMSPRTICMHFSLSRIARKRLNIE